MFAHRRHQRFLFTVAAVLTVCLCSITDARQWRHVENRVTRATDGDQVQDRPRKAVTFAAAVDGMIHACREEAVDLKAMLLDLVLQAVRLTDEQRTLLEEVPGAAQVAAEPTARSQLPERDWGASCRIPVKSDDHTYRSQTAFPGNRHRCQVKRLVLLLGAR